MTTMTRPPLVHLLVGGAAALYAWAVVGSTFIRPGSIGLDYNAPGTDYMVFHTAIAVARQGDLTTLYDPDRFTALLNQVFHASLHGDLEFRPWIYPPSFLLLLLPFGLVGFGLSYGLFQIITAAALWGGLQTNGRPAPWVAAACLLCPAASISVISGQCSFLIVALLAAGAGWVDRRPLLAGLALGVLTFKPQFFLMVPVLLLARSAWRASAIAGMTILAMAAVCLIWFGPDIWTGWIAAFTDSTTDVDPRWFKTGRLWGESVYTCLYLIGAPRDVAQGGQIVAMILAAATVWHAFRRPGDAAPRAAILLGAALLAAPHSGGYDLVLSLTAIALFLWHTGPRATSWDWSLGLLIWLQPMIGLPVQMPLARLGPLLTLALLGRISWHIYGQGSLMPGRQAQPQTR